MIVEVLFNLNLSTLFSMAIEEVPEVFEVSKLVDQCLLYCCACCIIVVVGVTLLVSFTNIVARI